MSLVKNKLQKKIVHSGAIINAVFLQYSPSKEKYLA